MLTRLSFSFAQRSALGYVRNFAKSSRQSSTCPIALIFDTETTGKVDFKRPSSDTVQPDLVQLGLLLVDTSTWDIRFSSSLLVNLREGVAIESGAQATHGISEADCHAYGVHPDTAARLFNDVSKRADVVVAHNISFDVAVMEAALHRSDLGSNTIASSKRQICTMQSTTDLIKIPGKFGSRYKWPTLSEAYKFVANQELEGGHDALVDSMACLRVFQYLVKEGVLQLSMDEGKVKREKETGEKKTESLLQASKIGAELLKYGLIVKQTSHGFTVGGNTFAIKEIFKVNGGKWDGLRKTWYFFGEDSLARLRKLAHQVSSSNLLGKAAQQEETAG